MMKNYFMRGMLLLGAAALVCGSAAAQEKGAWRNINYKVTNVSRANGWSGILTGSAERIGEWFPGAGLIYQVVPDAPAGVYTLTLHGINRPCGAPEAYDLFRETGNATTHAFAFINNTEVKIHNLFENSAVTTDNLLVNGEYQWGIVPNGLGEARAAFDAGEYETTVLCEHPGGDLFFGVKNYGYTEGHQGNGQDEWTCFADFKLVGPNGEVEIANPNFDMMGDDGWNIDNVAGSAKGRGNHNGAVYSKTNASPYNFGQTLTNMPAGKYRFVITAFNRDFLGNTPGVFVPFKGQYKIFEGESALDLYVGKKDIPMGQCSGNDEVYTPSGYVSPEVVKAYVYMNEGEKDAGWLEDNLNPWLEDGTVNGKEVAIKNIFDEELDEYPWAEQMPDADGYYQYTWWDEATQTNYPEWYESGTEVRASSFFVNNPSLYQNIVEMEFTGENNTFTIGTRKDFSQSNYWQPSFNWRLEYWDPEYVDLVNWGGEASVADLTNDENAPVEYFNLQGIRVAQPENGLYIVKQGKKVSKKVF